MVTALYRKHSDDPLRDQESDSPSENDLQKLFCRSMLTAVLMYPVCFGSSFINA